MVANHYWDGACYPTGGAAEIARRIIPTIDNSGGRVLVRAEVESILIEDGRACGVIMKREGVVIRAPNVISDAGSWNTYCSLLPS